MHLQVARALPLCAVMAVLGLAGCQLRDWFNPATLSPSPAEDGGVMPLSCVLKGNLTCVTCAMAFEQSFRVAASPSIALTVAGEEYALFLETARRGMSTGAENTRMDHVRLTSDGTVQPATSIVPGDWFGKTPSHPAVDLIGDSRYPSAASNGSVAAVVWQDHFFTSPQVLMARFDKNGNNLGSPLGVESTIAPHRLTKLSVTNLCRKGTSSGWDECGSATRPSLTHANGGWFGVAAQVAGNSKECALSTCKDLPGCQHPGVSQIYLFMAHPSPWKASLALRITGSGRSASNPSLVWSGNEFGVAWQDMRHDSAEIYFRRIKKDGIGLVGPEVRITRTPFVSSDPVLVRHGTGYGLVWKEARLKASQVYFTALDVQGRLTDKSARPITGSGNSAFNPSLVWTGKRFGLAWEDTRDGHLEVYFQVLDRQGTPLSTQIRISNATSTLASAPRAYYPRLAAGPSGEFGLAWIGSRRFLDANSKTLQDKKEVYFARVACQ